MFQEDLVDMNDEQLYRLCQKYGQQALFWRQKFVGLLPEVHRRELYRKNGCTSTFEFAAKLAGISYEHVQTVLRTEKRFRDFPSLHHLLISGEVSLNKLKKVAYIATKENEKHLADQVRFLPQAAVEAMVRDQRRARLEKVFVGKIQLSAGVEKRLLELQAKGININEMLTQLLDQRERQIAAKKKELAQNAHSTKRHIPVKIEAIVAEEHGTKCSIDTCTNAAEHTHHTQRFSIGKSHDPHFLAPLCKAHHVLAHSVDVTYTQWRNGTYLSRAGVEFG